MKPGWLQLGLWLRRREEPEQLVKVTRITRWWIELQSSTSDLLCRTKTQYLRDFYEAPAHFPCDDCARENPKTLCGSCLRRKTALSIGGKCELPHPCEHPFKAYPRTKLPLELEPLVGKYPTGCLPLQPDC